MVVGDEVQGVPVYFEAGYSTGANGFDAVVECLDIVNRMGNPVLEYVTAAFRLSLGINTGQIKFSVGILRNA